MTFPVRLEAARTLSPAVRELSFVRADGAPLGHRPGQWVNLFADDAPEPLKRSYSVASAPDGSAVFSLAVTRVEGGPMSTLLHALPVGAELMASGPTGLFVRAPEEPTPALFVATGTGLAPIRSMIAAARASAHPTPPMALLFGVRHAEDILYADELAEWAAGPHRVTVDITLSQPDATWSGRRGYVQEHLAAAWSALAAPDAHVFVCGLERMVSAVRALSRDTLGVPRRQIHHEKYD